MVFVSYSIVPFYFFMIFHPFIMASLFTFLNLIICGRNKLKMNPNLTQEQLKQQASMIGQMSDEQLKTAAAQAGNVNPMLKNMDPAMMR